MFERERLEVDRADRGTVPEGLAEMAPGAEMAGILERLDCSRLSGYDRIVVMQARSRLISHFQAGLYSDMVEVTESVADELGDHCDLEAIIGSAAMEIQAALSLTRRAAEYHLEMAQSVCERLPQVWVALDAGWIDLPKARVIVDQTLHLEESLAREVAERALVEAATLTTGQLRARIARLVITVDPDSAKKRYQQGLEERRVSTTPNPDGTANLYGLNLPADLTHAAMRRINRLARAAKTKDDPRDMDQIRADVLIDVLTGRTSRDGHEGAVVDIRVDATTLAGLDDDPGSLPGWGPIIAEVARRIVDEQRGAEHRITAVTDDGEPMWTANTRRRPTANQRRRIEAVSPTCVFPGCRMPARQCDIDHHQEWACSGPTEDWNLGPTCRRDHVGRHRGWHLEQLRPGVYRWTSLLGHVYKVGPIPP